MTTSQYPSAQQYGTISHSSQRIKNIWLQVTHIKAEESAWGKRKIFSYSMHLYANQWKIRFPKLACSLLWWCRHKTSHERFGPFYWIKHLCTIREQNDKGKIVMVIIMMGWMEAPHKTSLCTERSALSSLGECQREIIAPVFDATQNEAFATLPPVRLHFYYRTVYLYNTHRPIFFPPQEMT